MLRSDARNEPDAPKRNPRVVALIVYNFIAVFFVADLDAVTFTSSVTFQKALINVAVVLALNIIGFAGAWWITRREAGARRKIPVYALNLLLFFMLLISIAYTAQFLGGGLIY